MLSTDSAKVLACPHVAVVDSPTVCAPLTVAPDAGYVNATVNAAGGGGGGGAVVFDTVTGRVAVAVALVASVTVALSVRAPFATVVVFQLKLEFVPL